jgi:hypothetical protein
LNKKVDGHPAPLGNDKYCVQAVHQILRTDTKLKSRRQETKNLETQIKEKLVMGVKLDFVKDKKETEESTGADEDGSSAGVSADGLGNMASLNQSSSSLASGAASDEGLALDSHDYSKDDGSALYQAIHADLASKPEASDLIHID